MIKGFFSKIPVTIEAIQWDGTAETFKSLIVFANYQQVFSRLADNMNQVTIQTLEGKMKANVGDFIIKGVHGEFYPCKKEIFIETYKLERYS